MGSDSFPSPDELKGAVLGTLLYVCVYTVVITFQSFSKQYLLAQKKKEAKQNSPAGKPTTGKHGFFRSIKYYNSEDLLALCGDRAVGNFLEQAIIFLPLYWIHALFVDPSKSWTIALMYSASRCIYPLAFHLHFSGQLIGALGLSTGPGYLVTFYFIYEIVTKFAFA